MTSTQCAMSSCETCRYGAMRSAPRRAVHSIRAAFSAVAIASKRSGGGRTPQKCGARPGVFHSPMLQALAKPCARKNTQVTLTSA